MGGSVHPQDHSYQLQLPGGPGSLTESLDGQRLSAGSPAAQGGPAPEFLALLARGWKTAVAVALLVTLLVAAAVLRAPPRFEAESRLMVRVGGEYVYRPELGGSGAPRAPTLSEMVNSEVEILSSRDLAEQVVRSIGVATLYPELLDEVPDAERAAELAVPRFREAADIRAVLESSVIKVRFEHALPEVAARAVNLLVDRFTVKRGEIFSEVRSAVFETELADREGTLRLAEQALDGFKRDNAVADLAEERRLLLARRLEVQDELRASELALVELRLLQPGDVAATEPVVLPPHLAPGMREELLRQRHDLERELRALEPAFADQLVREASLRLLDLELRETELLRDFNEGNRQVQAVRAEIAGVRRFLAEARDQADSADAQRTQVRAVHADGLHASISTLDAEIELLVREERQRLQAEAAHRLSALELRCADLRRSIEGIDARVRELGLHEGELRRLERAVAAAGAALSTFREQADEARLADVLAREKRVNVRVIERAVAPVVPSGLPRRAKLGLGAFAGLLAGIGSVLLLDLLRLR